METKGEWNALSQEDAMIMALTSMIENKNIFKSQPKATNTPRPQEKSNRDSQGNISAEERAKLREAKIPDWKKLEPGPNDPKSKEVNGRRYHWCTKCRNGKGMWDMHEKHDDSFQSGKTSSQGILKNATSNQKPIEEKRKVTFNAVEEKDDDNSRTEITVNESLFKNEKSYLAQFTDFQ